MTADARDAQALRAALGAAGRLEPLGRGGAGEVYPGEDPVLGRELAVKVLRPGHRGRAELERRFVGEARLGGRLGHPGVAPVHALGQLPDGRPYFTRKLVRGRTPAALLEKRSDPAADRPRLLKAFEQVCQTLAYAHSKGVIHRDHAQATPQAAALAVLPSVHRVVPPARHPQRHSRCRGKPLVVPTALASPRFVHYTHRYADLAAAPVADPASRTVTGPVGTVTA